MELKNVLNQVEFRFLRNAYPLNEKLICYFNTGAHVPQTGDWVGLYKIGWKNTNEHKLRRFVSLEDIENSRKANIEYGFIAFEQQEIPKDLEGYYQFVYVTKNDMVRGVSRPFQFEMESRELRDELKDLRREMWENVDRNGMWQWNEQTEMWNRIEERERELRERELRGLRKRDERECEQREREERECEQREREERECEQRERELRKREQREIREVEREQMRELRERERLVRELEQEAKLKYDLNNNRSNGVESIRDIRLWEKINEDSVVSKLVHKYLSNLKSKNDEEFVKKFEELFVENTRLTSSLKSRVSEIAELKRECDSLRLFNTELASKLSNDERKIEGLERELECESRRKHEPETLGSCFGKPRSKKQIELVEQENERLREQLKRLASVYQNEAIQHSVLKNRLEKINDTLVRPLSKRFSDKPMSESEEELKHLIDELKIVDSKLSGELRPEVPFQSVPTRSASFRERIVGNLAKVNSHPEYLGLIETTQPRPMTTIETYPSISVSTSIPEITQKLSAEGKLSTEAKLLSELIFMEQFKKKAEQLRKKSNEDQWKGQKPTLVEEQVRVKLNGKQPELKEIVTDKGVEVIYTRDNKSNPSVWVLPIEETKINQQHQHQHHHHQHQHQQQQQQQQQPQRPFLKLLDEAKQQLKDRLTTPTSQYSSICPVCGIAVSKELNQAEFELHVNSHFTD